MKKYEIKRKDGSVKYYDFLSPFFDGYAAVKEKEKWGFIDAEGNEICPIKYEFPFGNEEPGAFWEGFAVVGIPTEDGFLRFGYINTEGKEVSQFIYTGACDFHNGVAWVQNQEMKWFLINKEFKTVTKRTYDKIHDFFFGYAVVELDGKFGFIDESGDEICEIKYDYMSCFNEKGIAQITIPNSESGRTYWIDKEGKEYYLLYTSDKMHPLT